MCKISKEIKFCTCNSGAINLENLENYWILKRNNKLVLENDTIIGSFETMILENDEKNKIIILNRLQDPDAFDIPIQFNEGDCFEIHLKNNFFSNALVYSFEFENGKWKSNDYDPFKIDKPTEIYKLGKIEDAIEENE